jgi:hypothetical protein
MPIGIGYQKYDLHRGQVHNIRFVVEVPGLRPRIFEASSEREAVRMASSEVKELLVERAAPRIGCCIDD